MIVILKCAIFVHSKPNLINWIASNTNLMKAPNTNFTKFVKNWFVQIKFFQILPKCHYYKSKYHQILPGTPKYWYFGSFFSICEHQMSLLVWDWVPQCSFFMASFQNQFQTVQNSTALLYFICKVFVWTPSF